ncbi:MAG TPA: hypothetical protein VGK35_10075 [Actinotalea sp.]
MTDGPGTVAPGAGEVIWFGPFTGPGAVPPSVGDADGLVEGVTAGCAEGLSEGVGSGVVLVDAVTLEAGDGVAGLWQALSAATATSSTAVTRASRRRP